MTNYLLEIKRRFRDTYGFTPSARSKPNEPVFDDIPDGDYPMEIDGKVDHVKIQNGAISCCNFKE